MQPYFQTHRVFKPVRLAQMLGAGRSETLKKFSKSNSGAIAARAGHVVFGTA